MMSISRAITELARRDPDAVAVVDDDGALTRAEIDARATALARHYARLADVGHDDRVVVALPQGAGFVLACLAVWRLGATPVPVSPALPAAERDAVVAAAEPVLVVDPGLPPPPERLSTDTDVECQRRHSADVLPDLPDLPDLAASSWKATVSGGSTGPPKVVESTGPAVVDPDAPVAPYLPTDQVQLVSGPLHHSAAFTYALRGLMTGHRLVILPRFDERAVLRAVADHGVTWMLLTPAAMHRIARLPAAERAVDWSSLETLLHLGAPCPPELKRTWIERVGAERVVEVYASAESAGITMIRGDEWLAHPGSVGRPVGGSRFRVVGDDGVERAPGEIGEVVMTRTGGPRYRYRGGEPRRLPGWEGWDALGDLGRLDADGYLYLVDRAADVIATADGDVYPARVEAALERHPAVRSAAVVGRDGGVHALLDLDGSVAVEDVLAEVTGARVPDSAEVVDGPLRDDAGKLRRAALAAAAPGCRRGAGVVR